MSELALFDVAREALAEAVKIDEVKSVRDRAQQAKLYARQAKDKTLLANASALQLRAERRLGELIIAAKEAGEISRGGRPRDDDSDGDGFQETSAETVEVLRPATLKEIGVDHKLSSTAQRWAKLGDEEFEQKLDAVRDKIISGAAVAVNPLRDLTTEEKKARRAEREAELGARQVALPAAKFGVIYADPEWEHEVWSDSGMHKAAANIYPVSGLDAIKSRDVGSLAADDAILFIWTTVPHLDQAFEVVAAWGFGYVSSAVWVKQYPGNQHGMGYWFRIDHEILIVATRGRVPAPAPGTQFPSVIYAPVREHSRKPDEAYEIIEAYYPTLPKIELNARSARPGWARWGFEAPGAGSEAIQPAPDGVPADESRAAVAGETGEVSAAAASPVTGRADYQRLLDDAAALKGQHTRETAEPILRAGYAAEPPVPLVLMALDLGHKLSTVKSWAFRSGLTDMNRNAINATALAAQIKARREAADA